MLFYEQPTDPWLPFDFKLLEAYQILQDETCPICNQPTWLCRQTENPNLTFKVKTATCFADRELKKAEAAAEKAKTKNAQKSRQALGTYKYTVAEMIDGSDLPTRADYFESLTDKVE